MKEVECVKNHKESFGAGMAILLACLTAISPLAAIGAEPVQKAEETNQPELAAMENIMPPMLRRIPPGSLAAVPTGMQVTIDLPGLTEGPVHHDPPFETNVRVWNDSAEETNPSIVTDAVGGLTIVAFQHFNGADWDIYLGVSTDEGLTWSVRTLADTSANETNPSLAMTSTGAFALAYQDSSDNRRMFAFKSNNGLTWEQFLTDLTPAMPLANPSFPNVVTQLSPFGRYPDGVIFAWQIFCSDATDCGGGSYTIFWYGSSDWSSATPSLDLGGSYLLADSSRAGKYDFVNLMHPSAGWSSRGYFMAFDDEGYTANERRTAWLILDEPAVTVNYAWVHNWWSQDPQGCYPVMSAIDSDTILMTTIRNSTITGHQTDHRAFFFSSDDGWISPLNADLLDTTETDQRAFALTGHRQGSLTSFMATYYSDSVVTSMSTFNIGYSWHGPFKISDNAGTGVNDYRSTSVWTNTSGFSKIAWQDDRDGDVNIYVTTGIASESANDTVGPWTKCPQADPNPYVKNYSTSLRASAFIDDRTTGRSNIVAAQLVITDTSVNNPLLVDWTNAWAMNLTGYNSSMLGWAWLWMNDTAKTWPVDTYQRLWMRGQDSKSNWGKGAFVDVHVVSQKVPRAPTMTKAELSGSGFVDVKLTWSKSPDDGGGADDVDAYTIWRSGAVSGPFASVGTVPATNTMYYSWNDSGVGHGNPSDYFYRVTASSQSYVSSPTWFAGKFQRSMTGAKQLVSVPLEQANDSPSMVFQTFYYEYVRTYVAGTPNPWWCHKPGLFMNSLNQISVIQGYWVQMDGSGTMTVAGLVPRNITVTLKSGWNMIGFPSFSESYTFADLNAATGGLLQHVEMYDASAGPYYLQKVLRNAWATTSLEPGYAYMVRVSSDVNWRVPDS